ncbi:MAG TPA: hypothetical protein VGE16_05620 [Albitalea sp.]
MIRQVISAGLFALTVGTLWSLSRQLNRKHSEDAAKRPHAPVHTWEGEGGALPATGPQMGPDPVVPASTAAVKPQTVPGSVH